MIQYRKAKRFLKILTPELAMHTLQVDNCKTIAEIMDDICKKLQIPNNKESSLAFKDGHSQEKDEDLDKVFLIFELYLLSFSFFQDDERIKRQMKMLQEKQNLHTEAEGNRSCQLQVKHKRLIEQIVKKQNFQSFG